MGELVADGAHGEPERNRLLLGERAACFCLEPLMRVDAERLGRRPRLLVGDDAAPPGGEPIEHVGGVPEVGAHVGRELPLEDVARAALFLWPQLAPLLGSAARFGENVYGSSRLWPQRP